MTKEQLVKRSTRVKKNEINEERIVKINIKNPKSRAPLTLHELIERKIFASFQSMNYTLEDYQKVLWINYFNVGPISVCACMTYHGVGKIVQFELGDLADWSVGSDTTKSYYTNILTKLIGETLKSQKIARPDCILQIDPRIRSERIYEWRHDHKKEEFHKLMFGWPNNSMDMNPMRPIIKLLKSKMYYLHKSHPDMDSKKLWRQIIKSWGDIPVDQVRQSIDKMPERIEAVLNNNGEHIKYI